MSSPHDTLALVGTTIAEKYAVEAVVGEGGFACVYRAMHLVWKRPVAVKVFKALGEVPADQRGKLLEDFIQEGALLADLSERSAAIVQARDVGMLTTTTGEIVPYMVLEWLEGSSLDRIVEAERAEGLAPRSIGDVVALLDPVAEALGIAHAKGVAHRDIKPANVVVLGDARAEKVGVKLLDFGIAKVVQDAQKRAGAFSKTGGQITSFTPQYGAPEQFDRSYGATGPWTDVYALALIVTELVCDRDALAGDDLMQLAFATGNREKRPTPRSHGVELGDRVEAVLSRALAVTPAERYPSATEFWNVLREAVAASAETKLFPAGDLGAARTLVAPVDGSPITPQILASPEVKQAVEVARAQAKQKGGGATIAVVVVALVTLGSGAGAMLVWKGRSAEVAGPPARATSSAVAVGATVKPAPAACPPGMARIEGGDFFMGSDLQGADAREVPAHPVRVGAYCLDVHEVTVAKHKACSDSGTCLRAGRENEWPEGISAAQKKIYDPLCNVSDPEARAQHPINCVTWEQARAYCDSVGGRLPTEAEWEFAARGSDGRVYPWGDTPPTALHLNACGKECVAWGKAHPDPAGPLAPMHDGDDGFPTTAPVGRFPQGKTESGVYDMTGNVWEWVADWYAPYAKSSERKQNPAGPATGNERVIRGGAWNGGTPSWVRPTFRYSDSPDKRSHGIGFRCAKSL